MDRIEKIRYYHELLSAKAEFDRWPKYKEHDSFANVFALLLMQIAELKVEFEEKPITEQEFVSFASDLALELAEVNND